MLGIVVMILNIIFYLIEALLLLRFVLILFSANLSAPFARWVFDKSQVFLAPFGNIFPRIDVAGFDVDFTVLFALLVYAIVGQLIISLVDLITNSRTVR